jgi:EpsI family protein
MISRRDLLVGGACLGAAGGAFALTPRERLQLLVGDRLDRFVPATFGPWTSEDVNDLIAPDEGTLAATLYSETVGRVYTNSDSGDFVMMLLAYGDTQSDRLQLHRPEVCYPAFGFTIESNVVSASSVGGARLPVRKLVASAPGRRENVTYWSRLGEYLPTDGRAQRAAKLRTAMRGYVADGLLARFSMVGSDSKSQFATTERFIEGLLSHVTPKGLPAMVGTGLAKQIEGGRALKA